MAEEPINIAAPAAPAVDAGTSVPSAPAPIDTPVPDTSIPAPSTPDNGGETAPTSTVTSFLDAAPKVAEAVTTAPADAQPVVEAKPAEGDPKTVEPVKTPEQQTTSEIKDDKGSQSDEPAPLPVYEQWKLPEDLKLDEKDSTEFNTLLGELQNTTKSDGEVFQKFGQSLVDKHIAAVNTTVGRVHEAYQTAWQKQTDGWRESFIKDPEIGGKRQETTIRLANEFIDTHGGTAENKAAFREIMKQTGLGVHPEVMRLLSSAMSRMSEGKPLPANPPMASVSKTQKWYGKKTG